MVITKLVNIKGDLFATGFCFMVQAFGKLCSSMVLTRVLRPEAYGIITILTSIAFVVEMLSDIGVAVSFVRHKDGDNPHYLNTAWTVRLIRSGINGAILLLCAPIFASLYQTPELTIPLRVLSLWFVINGLESMSFLIAIRRKNSRVTMYSELAAFLISTVFSVTYCYLTRSYWGVLYGILINRGILVLLSYQFYKEARPRFELDRAARRDLFEYSKFSVPSSLLTLALTQFDKIVFLRLFDLQLLGVYGLAGNIAAPVEGLISKISQQVLYPRCAHNYRTNPATFGRKFYTENIKLFASILIFPAVIGGGAVLIIPVLYDSRYARAAFVLQAFMIRAALLSFASPAEDLLVATGKSHIIFVGNVFRAAWMLAASLTGYSLFGFAGFVYGTALSGLPPLVYYFWLQRKEGLLTPKYEVYKVLFACSVAITVHVISRVVLEFFHGVRLGA